MSSLGTGNPFTQDFRLLRGNPATLNGSAGAGAGAIATNNALVAVSTRDPWIQAVDNGAPLISVPAFLRTAAVISFDFYLCSGNGSPVPNDIVELIFPSTLTAVATAVANGTALILDENIAAIGVLAPAGALIQGGRRVFLRANSDGRVNGSVTQDGAGGDITVIVKYRHITTSLTTAVAPT